MNAIWMITACFLLTLMGACVKLVSDTFNTAFIVFMRGAVPFALLAVWVGLYNLPLRTPLWRQQIKRALYGTTAMLMFFGALAELPLGMALTLSNTPPLFMGAMMARQRGLQPGILAALLVGFIGIAMVLQPTFERDQWLGGLLGLGSGFMAAVAQLNLRELGKQGEPEWRTVFYFALGSVLVGLPLAAVMPPAASVPVPADWGGLLAVGVLGGTAQLAMSRAYSSGRTLVTASLLYSNVVMASILGIIIWDDQLGLLAWCGIATVIAAGLMALAWQFKQARSDRVAESAPAAADNLADKIKRTSDIDVRFKVGGANPPHQQQIYSRSNAPRSGAEPL